MMSESLGSFFSCIAKQSIGVIQKSGVGRTGCIELIKSLNCENYMIVLHLSWNSEESLDCGLSHMPKRLSQTRV